MKVNYCYYSFLYKFNSACFFCYYVFLRCFRLNDYFNLICCYVRN
jgi:hypothetical protein